MRRVAMLASFLLAAASLGQAQQLPPAPKPAAVVPGTPAAAGRSFVVFFDEWSAKLGSTGTQAVAQAAENARSHPGVPVLVTGFAANDAGSPTANVLMSRTRAQIVVDELVKDGVEASRIKGTAVGGSSFALDPIEARRVTISVGAV